MWHQYWTNNYHYFKNNSSKMHYWLYLVTLVVAQPDNDGPLSGSDSFSFTGCSSNGPVCNFNGHLLLSGLDTITSPAE